VRQPSSRAAADRAQAGRLGALCVVEAGVVDPNSGLHLPPHMVGVSGKPELRCMPAIPVLGESLGPLWLLIHTLHAVVLRARAGGNLVGMFHSIRPVADGAQAWRAGASCVVVLCVAR
jgi:hypothetical protein